MKKANDFGRDSIPLLVLKISIPFMIAQFVNVFYSIVDRIYVGNIPGTGADALAGVGICAPIVTLLSSFGTLFGIGGSVLFSVRLGAGDEKGAKAPVKQFIPDDYSISVADGPVSVVKGLAPDLVRSEQGDVPICGQVSHNLYGRDLFCPDLYGDELFYHCPGFSGARDDDHPDRRCDQYCP